MSIILYTVPTTYVSINYFTIILPNLFILHMSYSSIIVIILFIKVQCETNKTKKT